MRELDSAGTQYLAAGGIAASAYGYQRLTQDLDLIIGMDRENILSSLEALSRLGYRPLASASLKDFADPEKRREWIGQESMQVFSLASDTHPDTTVNIFSTEPFDFSTEHAAAEVLEIAPDVFLPLVRLPTLIAMKQKTNRAIDQDDVQHLSWIFDERNREEAMTNQKSWDTVTWEGSRRAQIRRNLRLSPRQRLEALEALTETSRVLSQLRKRNPSERKKSTPPQSTEEHEATEESGNANKF